MEFRIVSGNPTAAEEAAVREALLRFEAEDRARTANSEASGWDPWVASGRLAAHRAAGSLADVRSGLLGR